MQMANPEKKGQYELYLAEEPINAPKGEEGGEGLIISYWRSMEHSVVLTSGASGLAPFIGSGSGFRRRPDS